MFVKRSDGKVGFLPYGLLSKCQYIVNDANTHKQLSKVLNISYTFIGLLSVFLFVDFRLYILVIIPLLYFHFAIKKALINVDREEHRKKHKLKNLLLIALQHAAYSKKPISWFIAVLATLFFLILFIYLLINDISTSGLPIDTIYLGALPFLILLEMFFVSLFIISIRN
jgi:hypothetical protein